MGVKGDGLGVIGVWCVRGWCGDSLWGGDCGDKRGSFGGFLVLLLLHLLQTYGPCVGISRGWLR